MSILRAYIPTIACLAVLVIDRLLELAPTLDRTILAPVIFAKVFSIDALLVAIVELLPSGPWQAHYSGIIYSSPNIEGWLIASLIILVLVLLLNYILVVRNRVTSSRALSIALLLALLVLPPMIDFLGSRGAVLDETRL